MKGYNLPDNVSPNDPEAPWNEEEQEQDTWEPIFICEICGMEFESMKDKEACIHTKEDS